MTRSRQQPQRRANDYQRQMRAKGHQPLMRAKDDQPRMRANGRRYVPFLAVFFAVTVVASGCAVAHKRAAIPWGTAVLVRPNLPEVSEEGSLDEPLAPAEIEIPPPAEPMLLAPAAPVRPRAVASSTSPATGASESSDLPQFVPDLSPQESASSQQQTEENLNATERSLAAVAGKSLNGAQTDLLSKVRSFLTDAREAARAGDWARARDLSGKARVLSDQLAGSF